MASTGQKIAILTGAVLASTVAWVEAIAGGGVIGGGSPSRVPVTWMGSRHYTAGRGGRAPNLIVIHTIEGPKNASAAESTGRMFATSAREASAHYTVDSDSIVQSVDERNTGWHAPGANDRGIGIEHAGYAKQTAVEWDDPYNRAMLALSARLAADIADRWNIPTRRLSQAELLAGYSGFVSHDDVSRAYGKSNHWDPGPNFPWAAYLAQVDAARYSTGRYA